jgi:hypothetical protein
MRYPAFVDKNSGNEYYYHITQLPLVLEISKRMKEQLIPIEELVYYTGQILQEIDVRKLEKLNKELEKIVNAAKFLKNY